MSQTRRGKEEHELNVLFTKYIRAKYPLCVICGMCPTSECAHLFGVGSHPRIRWQSKPDNAVGACHTCHRYYTDHPAAWFEWVALHVGIAAYHTLLDIERKPSPDRTEVRCKLHTLLGAIGQ